MFNKHVALALVGLGQVLAQRPSGTSICDYYTTALLKDNTAANQYTLLTLLVNTVVIGNYTMPNVGVTVPGILAPASYNGESVNLLPYFNGCLMSTNVNDVASSVNFLDGGGAAPLKMNMPANSMSSNQYFLLTHLYQFFGKLLGCSGYGKMGFPAYGGDPSMYRVHKYMNLDPAELGYFISQVGAAAASFGVATADIQAVAGALNMYFGYKCSPPTDVGFGSYRQSMCGDNKCPTDPKGDCYKYPNFPNDPKLSPQCAPTSKYEAPKTTTAKYEAPKTTAKYEAPKPTTSAAGWSGWSR